MNTKTDAVRENGMQYSRFSGDKCTMHIDDLSQPCTFETILVLHFKIKRFTTWHGSGGHTSKAIRPSEVFEILLGGVNWPVLLSSQRTIWLVYIDYCDHHG